MFKQTLLITLTILTTKSNSHVSVTRPDIIIMGDHADLQDDYLSVNTDRPEVGRTTKRPESEQTTIRPVTTTTVSTTKRHGLSDSDENLFIAHEKDAVLFVPTEKQDLTPSRDEEFVHAESVRLTDLMDERNQPSETEAPLGEILFISGKNAEIEKMRESDSINKHGDARREMDFEEPITTKKPKIKLDCKNLDCTNEVGSICGAKYERSEWRYRLFLNDCYFRKVNCGFSYEANRYQLADIGHCKNVASHSRKPGMDTYSYMPIYIPVPVAPRAPGFEEKKGEDATDFRRSSGRRAMVMNFGASYCSHLCPTTCPDEYEPECALSAAGERRVFANHCKLDRASCQFGMMWRKRPLAECVGGQKADMRQNRAFISWMQRVGIVDKKGKLVLNK